MTPREAGSYESRPEPEGTELLGEGTELLGQELRAEVGRLVHQPASEIKRLEGVAARGESASTPLLATTGVALFILAVFAVVVTIVFLVYYLA